MKSLRIVTRTVGFYQDNNYHNIPFVAAPLYLIFSTFSLLPSQHGKILLSPISAWQDPSFVPLLFFFSKCFPVPYTLQGLWRQCDGDVDLLGSIHNRVGTILAWLHHRGRLEKQEAWPRDSGGTTVVRLLQDLGRTNLTLNIIFWNQLRLTCLTNSTIYHVMM